MARACVRSLKRALPITPFVSGIAAPNDLAGGSIVRPHMSPTPLGRELPPPRSFGRSLARSVGWRAFLLQSPHRRDQAFSFSPPRHPPSWALQNPRCALGAVFAGWHRWDYEDSKDRQPVRNRKPKKGSTKYQNSTTNSWLKWQSLGHYVQPQSNAALSGLSFVTCCFLLNENMQNPI